MDKYTFYGEVVNGHLRLERINRFKKFLEILLDGKRVKVTIEERKNIRSLRQNSYYWGGVLDTIEKETGNISEDLHKAFKRKFLTPKIIGIKDTEFMFTRSTTELSVGEFVEYIEKIRACVAEFGITLPDPEEYDFAPLKENE